MSGPFRAMTLDLENRSIRQDKVKENGVSTLNFDALMPPGPPIIDNHLPRHVSTSQDYQTTIGIVVRIFSEVLDCQMPFDLSNLDHQYERIVARKLNGPCL